jgi:hypothetical protein
VAEPFAALGLTLPFFDRTVVERVVRGADFFRAVRGDEARFECFAKIVL